MDVPDLKAPSCYINRELSFLEFNHRVLALAFDETVPLLERLKFLCISSGNLDEFFEIRVAGLKHLQELGKTQQTPDAMSIPELLDAIHTRAQHLCAEQYRCLNDVLLPKLAHAGVSLQGPSAWTQKTRRWLEKYFENEIEPVLSAKNIQAGPLGGLLSGDQVQQIWKDFLRGAVSWTRPWSLYVLQRLCELHL